MPIPLPNLDDTTYAKLVGQALQRIPEHAPEWTNHNESDPGITLVQLLAYFTEILIYQTNEITDGDRTAFSRLLGAQHVEGTDADEELKQAIIGRRVEQRAVTPADFERHALAADPGVARARCLARRNLEKANQAARLADRPGHVTVLVLPHTGAELAEVLPRVRASLEQRRLLTVKVHVTPVPFVRVRIRFRVIPKRGASGEAVRRDVTAALEEFLDPLTGGHHRKGWPFGRSIFVSELYRIVAKLPDVDHVTAPVGSGTNVRGDVVETLEVEPGRATRDEAGELTALRLFDEELPLLAGIDLEVAAE
jgi:phage-related baseplate assembly protein